MKLLEYFNLYKGGCCVDTADTEIRTGSLESMTKAFFEAFPGVSPDDGFVLHNVFFPQTSEKEPFQKKFKRLSSKSAPEVPARPILPSQ